MSYVLIIFTLFMSFEQNVDLVIDGVYYKNVIEVKGSRSDSYHYLVSEITSKVMPEIKPIFNFNKSKFDFNGGFCVVPSHVMYALDMVGKVYEYKGKKSHPLISKYLARLGFAKNDEIPWCAAWLNGILEDNKIAGTKSGMARSFLNFGYKLETPKVGCLVVLKRGNSRIYGHVGIYLDEDEKYIYVLGGNQGDRVGISKFLKRKLLSYRWSNDFEKNMLQGYGEARTLA